MHLLALDAALVFLCLQAWGCTRGVLGRGADRDPNGGRAGGGAGWLRASLPELIALAPFPAISLALFLVQGARGPLSTAIVLATGLGMAGLLRISRMLLARLGPRPRVWIGRLGAALGLSCAMAVFLYIWLRPPAAALAAMMVGPSALCILGAACLIPGWVWLARLGDLCRAPASAALIGLAVVLSLCMDSHEIGRRAWPAVQAPRPVAARPTLEEALKAWRLTGPSGNRIVLVAAEGGGARSALWTAQVLGTLEEASQGQFSRHLFAISAVSGADVGAAGFVAELTRTPAPAPAILHDGLLAFAGSDFTSPTLAGLLWPDFAQRFFAPVVLPDTAQYFEQGLQVAWAGRCPAGERGCAGALDQPFLDLFTGKAGAWKP
ncbi:MAG TPA: hypothetical protein VGC16_01695, partial [Rhizomicrobium sp.]